MITNGPLRKLRIKKVVVNQTISTVYDVYTCANPDIGGMVCGGDSGGAAQIEFFDGINLVLGIEKSIKPPGPCSLEAAFINVSKHQNWIESIAFNDF